jgi:FSR family fosmidomycin resistance protein-like MFS transporter
MMAGHICTDISQAAVPAILPFLVIDRGIDYASAAGLMFANSFLSSLVQPFLGMLSDRKTMPWLMSLGMLISGLGIALIGYLESYWAIFASVLFAGLGSAMFHPEGGRMANRVAGELKGRGVSIFAVGGNIGFVIGPIMATAAVSSWGLKGMVVILVPVLAMTGIFISQQKHFIQYTSAANVEDNRTDLAAGHKDNWPGFAKLCIPLFIRSIVATGIQVFIPLYWVAILMQTQKLSSMMVTVMAIAATFATLIGGRLADRFGFRKVIYLAFGTLSPLIVLLLLIRNVSLATLVVVILSAAVYISYSPSIALGQKYLPNRLGLASGITLGLTVSIGGICSPLLGKIGDIYGLSIALYVLAGIAFIGFIGAFFIDEA